MNQLSATARSRVVACLVEGNSIRATSRMTGVARNTVDKLLIELGAACSEYQDKTLRNLTCKRVQCDEIWSFVGCKEKNVPADMRRQGRGDVWTWIAIDAETKLVPCWYVGNRDAGAAYHFMHDLAERLANRVQLTTDAQRRPPLQPRAAEAELILRQAQDDGAFFAGAGWASRMAPALCVRVFGEVRRRSLRLRSGQAPTAATFKGDGAFMRCRWWGVSSIQSALDGGQVYR